MAKALVPARGVAIAGRYVLERSLGRGGMGSVWLAEAQGDDRVAIKLMEPRHVLDAELFERFEREAKAVARLSSPHVVRVLEHGVEGDTPFIVMEWVEGEDLMERLAREGHLTPAVTLAIARQIGSALSHAHERGVVHRDLKPENVMLTEVDGAMRVKLLDFGLAKVLDATRLTKTNTAMGSPRYMSPEQARSAGRVDHRTDLWSFAVLLFRCLAGKAIFDGKTTSAILLKVCYEPIPLASDIAPHMTPAMDRFFRKALQRDVSRRFASVSDLLTAFERALSGGDAAEETAPERAITEDIIDDSSVTRGWSLKETKGASVTRVGGSVAAGVVALALVLGMLGGEDLEATAQTGLSDAANRIVLAAVMARPDAASSTEPSPEPPPEPASSADEAPPPTVRVKPRPVAAPPSPAPPPAAAGTEPKKPAWGF